MNIKFYILAAAIFYCYTLAGQTPTRTYQWQWAVTGGSADKIIYQESLGGSTYPKANGEYTNDIAVDKNNNIYFTSHIANNAQFMGHTIPGHSDNCYYNGGMLPNQTYSDILIASLDCAGNYRWHYTIGGGIDDIVTDIETDTLGGVYISIQVSGKNPIVGDSIYFNNDTVYTLDKNQPTVTNGYIALVKLDTLGNLQWIRWACGPQGTGWYMFPQGLHVEPNGTIHWAQQIHKVGVYADGQMVITDSILQKNDLAVMKYDRNGNFLGYKMLQVKHAGSYVYGDPFAGLIFKYNQITEQYYLLLYNREYIIIGNDSIKNEEIKVPNGYISINTVVLTAFNSLGNYQWHHTGNLSGMRYIDFDRDGNSYIIVSCKNFANTVHSTYSPYEFDGSSFIIKIAPNGTIGNYREYPKYEDWYHSVPASSIDVLKCNSKEIGVRGNTPYSPGDIYVLKYLFLRLDPNNLRNGTPIDSVVWTNNPGTGGYSQAANIWCSGAATSGQLTTDNQGNYIFGGGVGTSFQLSPTVRISNSGWQSLSDFWIGKYAKYECGEQVESAVENVFIPKNNELLIYPNPVKDELRIKNEELRIGNVEIYDLTGKQIVNDQWLNGQSINVSALPAGIYILKIGDKRGKFIKE